MSLFVRHLNLLSSDSISYLSFRYDDAWGIWLPATEILNILSSRLRHKRNNKRNSWIAEDSRGSDCRSWLFSCVSNSTEFLLVFSHFWDRGTLFNPSSPSAAAIGSDIKAKVCKRAQVFTTTQAGLINENSVVNIIKFADYSLSTLKNKILTSQVGPSRRLCVWKSVSSLICVLISLSELQEYWVPTLMINPIQWN